MQNIVPTPRPGPYPASGPAGGQQRGEGQRSLALRFQLWAGLLLLGHFDQRTFNPFTPAHPLGKASLSDGGKKEGDQIQLFLDSQLKFSNILLVLFLKGDMANRIIAWNPPSTSTEIGISVQIRGSIGGYRGWEIGSACRSAGRARD